MDLAIISESTLKFKTKKTTLAINPVSTIAKFDADAILLLEKDCDVSRINSFRVIIDQPGEYEVSGLKIVGIKADDEVYFRLISDNTSYLIAKASTLSKLQADKIDDYKVAIINVDTELNQSLITAMEPRVLIFYGLKAKEAAKALGKESVVSAAKINFNEDKLSDEMELYILA